MGNYLGFEDAGYEVIQLSEVMRKGHAVEVLMDIIREEHHDHFDAENNEDWGTIIELAGQGGYVVLPMREFNSNRRQIRLIDKSLLTPVREELVILYKEVEQSYWAIQGDKMCWTLLIELESLAEQNIDIHEAIMDVSVQKRNRYLFNRNHYNQDWDTYKERLQLLADNISNMVTEKVPESIIEKVRDLSALY